MARISLEPPRTVLVRVAEWYSRRSFGAVLDPAKALAHNPRVLRTYLGFERSLARWDRLDPAIEHLAIMVSAARIGCSWCMDFGAWVANEQGLPAEKIRYVLTWREHPDVFTETERLVMEYAEAMTDTPPSVSDELAERLKNALGESAFVELTVMVAVENLRSRVNSAFGLTRQGFSDRCEVTPVR